MQRLLRELADFKLLLRRAAKADNTRRPRKRRTRFDFNRPTDPLERAARACDDYASALHRIIGLQSPSRRAMHQPRLAKRVDRLR